MNIKNIDRALLTGLFVGLVIFVKEFFFPDINVFISILIGALAAFVGFYIGDKMLSEKNNNHHSNKR